MVTKLFKLRFVEAEQMRNVLGQFHLARRGSADLPSGHADSSRTSVLNLGRLSFIIILF